MNVVEKWEVEEMASGVVREVTVTDRGVDLLGLYRTLCEMFKETLVLTIKDRIGGIEILVYRGLETGRMFRVRGEG